jgi:hypothetical protein
MLRDWQISHDQVTRLLASEPKNSADLWRVIKPLVRAIECPGGTLIDDNVDARSEIRFLVAIDPAHS